MNFLKIFSLFFILSIGFTTAASGQSSSTQNPFETSLVKQKVKVKGASCKVDLGMIVTNIKKLNGVKSCVIAKRGFTSTLEVEYDSDQVDFKTIKAAIESTGTCEDPNARQYKVS
jgi:copper chaperone CopZ